MKSLIASHFSGADDSVARYPPNMTLFPVTDPSPADWVVESLTEFSHDVAALVPDRFEAIARVFHPAWLGREDGRHVSWREIAEANGKTPHAGMQFRSITPENSFDHAGNQLKEQANLWDSAPSDGEIPDEIASQLVSILERFTNTPTECYFAYWEGWGDPSSMVLVRKGAFGGLRTRLALMKDLTVPPPDESPRAARDQAAHFKTPGRGYYLYRGDISEVTTPWNDFRSSFPTMWWPADHAWFVHTEIDLDTTFVGASRACIDTLLADDSLEAWEVELSQRITWDSDHINRQP